MPYRTKIPQDVEELRQLVRKLWREDSWFDTAGVPSTPPLGHWVAYETYMRALGTLQAVPGGIAKLWVEFPPSGTEDNDLHVHPKSDRVITVISGSGVFLARRPGSAFIERPLVTGDRVWMPRGVLHTFKAGNEGLLVESLHNPWVPLDDPRCLVYPQKGAKT